MTTPEMHEPSPRYRFGPLERRGGVAGWRTGQVVTVAVGLVLAVVLLRAGAGLAGAAGAAAVLVIAGALVTVPIAGRTGEEWVPDVASQLLGDRPSLPGRVRRQPWGDVGLVVVPRDRGPGAGTGPGEGPSAAALVDRRAGTVTAVVSVASPGFVLSGAAEQGARVAGWAQVLASLARPGGLVHRVQWVECLRPGEAARAEGEARGLRSTGGPVRAWEDYLALLRSDPVRSAVRHEALLAFTMRSSDAARRVRRGGEHADAGAAAVLLDEVALVRDRLGGVGLSVSPPLGPSELGAVLREASRPLSAGSASPGSVEPGGWCPWPLAVERRWESLRTDGTWHATYWVEQWPRTEVGPDALAGLLLGPGPHRAVALVLAPMSAVDAVRRAEQARTAHAADSELRRAGGFVETARRRRTGMAVAERERELADGHAHYRFTAYVRVTAADREELEAGCARIEQAGAQAGLELRRCFGDQLSAWMCTLPLGRGLR